jgi:hypothetical protein
MNNKIKMKKKKRITSLRHIWVASGSVSFTYEHSFIYFWTTVGLELRTTTWEISALLLEPHLQS